MITYKVVVDNYGDIYWYNEEGQIHCEHGPAVEWADGSKFWYLNGEVHREDGPAVEWAHGDKEWHLNGQCHRLDGPAIDLADGRKFWYLNGVPMTKKEKEHARANSFVKEMSVAEIENLLGYSVKIIKE